MGLSVSRVLEWCSRKEEESDVGGVISGRGGRQIVARGSVCEPDQCPEHSVGK